MIFDEEFALYHNDDRYITPPDDWQHHYDELELEAQRKAEREYEEWLEEQERMLAASDEEAF